jgi:hypothetical protein
MIFEFTNVRNERDEIRNEFDVLIGVTATFEIRIGKRKLYGETMFPIVELAVALRRWMDGAMESGEAFEFISLESDEVGLVWIRPDQDGWRIGSLCQEYAEPTIWSHTEIREAIATFVDEVADWLVRSTDWRLESLIHR